MKPLIGITSDLIEATLEGRNWSSQNLLVHYTDGLAKAGALPVILPMADTVDAERTVRRLDGIVFSGGVADIPPDTYKAERHPATAPMAMRRWDSEVIWLKAAAEANIPILGICLGMQIMNTMAGGTLIQDIPTQKPGPILHSAAHRMQPHAVELVPGSKLAAMAHDREMTVISAHHQAIASVPEPFVAAALAPDGIVEAFEDPTRDFLVAVQWHPERSPEQPDWVLSGFVRHCAGRLGKA